MSATGRYAVFAAVFAAWVLVVPLCYGERLQAAAKEETMQLASTSFQHDRLIPARYTCEGENVTPELHWENPPENTKSFALIADDPDAPAGTWVHWVLYNIPANMNVLPEGTVTGNGIRQGRNDFKKTGYGGPCPPHGHGPHRYFFKLYALDYQPGLKPGATKVELEDAMKGHILAEAELMGRFERQ